MTASRRNALLARSALCGVLGAVALGAMPALARIDPGNVTGSASNFGAPTITANSPTQTTVTLSGSRTVIDWSDFDTGAGNTANFVFGGDNWIVLNRVTGGQTTINGALNGCIGPCTGSNYGGNIWIYNANGVLFGSTAQVNVGGLLATTASLDRALDATPGGFLNSGTYNFSFTGVPSSAATVSVAGGAQINTTGSLALIAPIVTTSGALNANDGDALFGVADSYTITFAPDAANDLDLVSFNVPAGGGTSQTNGLSLGGSIAAGRVFASVVSKTGVTSQLLASNSIQATAVSGDGGDIVFSAGGGIAAGGVAGPATGGTVNTTLTGALTSIGGDIDITGSGFVTWTRNDGSIIASSITAGADANLTTASGAYDIAVDSISAVTGVAAIAGGTGSAIIGSATASGGAADVLVQAVGTATLGAGSAGRTLRVNGTNVANLGSGSAGLDVFVTGGAGGITVTGLVTAGDDIDIAASGAVSAAGATLRSTGLSATSDAGIRVRSTNSSVSVGSATTQGAGITAGDVSIEALTSAAVGTASSTRDLFIGGQAAAVISANAARDITLVGTTGGVTVSSSAIAGDDIEIFSTTGAINAANATLRSTGIGAINETHILVRSSGSSVSVGSATTQGTGVAAGDVTLQAQTTLGFNTVTSSANAALAATSGAITQGSGAITATNLTAFAGGAVTLGGANAVTNLSGSAGSGSFTYRDIDTINLDGNVVATGGALSLTSDTGAITQSGGAITAGTLNAAATTGITLNRANNFGVIGTVTNTTSGGISITEAVGIDISDGIEAVGQTINLVATAGHIWNTGGFIVGGTLNATATTGIDLDSTANDIDTIGGLSTTAGDIDFTDADGFDLAGAVTAASQIITLRAASGSITQSAGVITTSTLGVSATGSVTLDGANNIANLDTVLVGGDFTYRDVDALSLMGSIVGQTVSLTSDAGMVGQAAGYVFANRLNIQAGTGIGLTQATNDVVQLGNLITATGNVAYTDSINVAVSGAITGQTVTLNASGAISQAVGSVITANLLNATSSSGITLARDNQVTSLGAVDAGNGGFFYRDVDNIALTGNISAGTSAGTTVFITSNTGAISQTGGVVTANTLSAQAETGISFGQANAITNIGSLASFTSGGIAVRDANGFNIAGDITAIGQTLSLTANGGGGIIQGGGIITAGTLTAAADNGLSLTQGNMIDTLGAIANGAGALTINNAKALTVSGPVNNVGTVTLTTTAGALNTTGTITGSAIALTGAAGVTAAGELFGDNGVTVTATTGNAIVSRALANGFITVQAAAGDAALRQAFLGGASNGITVSASGTATLGADSQGQILLANYVYRIGGAGAINVISSGDDARVFLDNLTTALTTVDAGNSATASISVANGFTVGLVDGYNIVLHAPDGLISAGIVAVLGGDYTITAQDFGGSALNPVSSARNLTITDTLGGIVLAQGLSATGNIRIEALNGGAVTVNGMLAAGAGPGVGDVTLIGAGVTAAAVIADRDVIINAGTGAVSVTSVIVGRDYTLTGGSFNAAALEPTGAQAGTWTLTDTAGGLALGGFTRTYGGNIVFNVSGALTGTGAIYSASGSVTLDADSMALNNVNAAGGAANLTTDGDMNVTWVQATGGIAIDSGGAATFSNLTTAGDIDAAAAGDVAVANAVVGGSLSLESNGGALTVGRIQMSGVGAGRDLTLTSAGDLRLGAATAGAIAGTNLYSRAGTGVTSITSTSGSVVANLNATADLGSIEAATSVQLTLTGGPLRFDAITATTGDIVIEAFTSSLIGTGDLTSGRDVKITAAGVVVDSLTAPRDIIVASYGADAVIQSATAGDDIEIIASQGAGVTLRRVVLTNAALDINNSLTVQGIGDVTIGADSEAGITSDNAYIRLGGNTSVSLRSNQGDVNLFLQSSGHIGLIQADDGTIRATVLSGDLTFDVLRATNMVLKTPGVLGVVNNLMFFDSGDYSATAADFQGKALSPDNFSTPGNVTIVDTAGGLTLTNNLDVTGFLDITASGPLTIGSTLSTYGSIVLRSHGGMTIAAGGSVTSSATGDAIVLASDGAFTNNAGAGALSAANGRWLIYTQGLGAPTTPVTNVFGGLTGKNFYSSTYDFATNDFSTTPNAGNRFVYGYQPTLTVTPVTQTVTYNGTIPTLSALITGLINGDLAADAWSGAPALGGATSKNVGVYGLTAALGSLLSDMNYAFAFGTGTLTIDPKVLTGTVLADDKTYDGTSSAVGSISLTGAIAGDDVAAGATYAFADKTAGVGKAVTASGAALSGADAGNYTLDPLAAAVADILKKALSGTVTASNKTYDGTTAATGSVSLTGVIAGDSVGAGGGAYAFADANAGGGKTVTASGVGLTGADAANYTLDPLAGAIADILRKSLTGTLTASDKTYDGATWAAGLISLSGVVAGDNVAAIGTYDFSDENAGVGKTVTASGVSLLGADSANYDLTSVSTAVADILRRALTGVVIAGDKTYDGTALTTGYVNLSNVVLGDDVSAGGGTYSFADKNAGVDKTVTATGVTLSGADAANYTLDPLATAIADILRKNLTGALTASTKTYDGTATATGSVSLTGVVAGDDVSTGGGSFSFADRNAGVGKTVTATGVTLSGADAANYTLDPLATAVADILRKSLTGALTASTKTYDGTTTATGSVSLTGVIAGDDVSTGGETFTFADRNAGVGKTVTATGVGLTGADAGNYDLTAVSTAIADILRKALTATVVVQDKTYDGTTAASGSVTLAGLIAGDAAGATAGSYAFADVNAGAGKTVIVSGVSLNGADAGNYVLNPLAPSLASILRRAVAITADDQTKRFGQPDPALTWTLISGSLVQGDAVSGALARASGEQAGTYVIGRGSLSLSQNYDLSFTPGAFVIEALPAAGQDGSDALRYLGMPASFSLYRSPMENLLVVDERGDCPDGQTCPQISQGEMEAGAAP